MTPNRLRSPEVSQSPTRTALAFLFALGSGESIIGCDSTLVLGTEAPQPYKEGSCSIEIDPLSIKVVGGDALGGICDDVSLLAEDTCNKDFNENQALCEKDILTSSTFNCVAKSGGNEDEFKANCSGLQVITEKTQAGATVTCSGSNFVDVKCNY